MRGTVAKRLREKARAFSEPTVYKRDMKGTVMCWGYRRVYQDMKAEYKRGER